MIIKNYEVKRMPGSFFGNHDSCFLTEFLFISALFVILDNYKVKTSFLFFAYYDVIRKMTRKSSPSSLNK